MRIAPHSKVLFIGDSITDAGRDGNQKGEGLFEAYGRGYVIVVKGLLDCHCPQHRLRVLNQGVSGNNVRALADRWQRDVLAHNPDWLSVCIGINDVWRQFDTPLIVENHVPLEEYEHTLQRLLEKTRPGLKGLVLMTPYVIEPNRDDAMRLRMTEYAQAVRRLASRYDAVLVDTQAAFDAYLEHYHPMSIAWDRIHPNLSGHTILASAWLRAVGFQWQG